MGRDGRGVRAASETSIEITFMYRGERCRERIRLKPTPANMRAAERHKAAVEDSIAKGTFNYLETFPESPRVAKYAERPGQVTTVESYLESWLDRQEQHVKASTLDGYRKVVNMITKKFGEDKLSDIRRPKIRSWCSDMKSGNKRIANILSVFRQALQDALDDELIDENPLYGWSFKRKDAPKVKDDIDPFSPAEQAAILAQLSEQTLNLIQFAFWTGLRTSELIAVEWGDVDELKGEIHIQRALTQVAKEAETPKTKAGNRRVKLLPPAMRALKAQQSYSRFHESGRVFINPRTGEPWTGDLQIRDGVWKRALIRAGVRYRRPYQTRHTYASMMLSAGESPMWVAQQMGHSDWTMIARVYGRWIPEANPDAGSKAIAAFAKDTNDSILPASARKPA